MPKRDIVTEASMDSFPASDPPGWIRTVASTAEASDEVNVIDVGDAEACEALNAAEETVSTAGPKLRRAKRIALGVLAGGLAIGALAGGVALVRRMRA